METGLAALRTGEIWRVRAVEMPPSGLRTIRDGYSERARISGVMSALSSVALMKEVASGVPFSLAMARGCERSAVQFGDGSRNEAISGDGEQEVGAAGVDGVGREGGNDGGGCECSASEEPR
jgi:hypothetical protein